MTDCKYVPGSEESKILISIYVIGIPALLYFLGWMTLFYYLEYYGIYLFSTDIPFHFFFIYSFSVIKYVVFYFLNLVLTYPILTGFLIFVAAIVVIVAKYSSHIPVIHPHTSKIELIKKQSITSVGEIRRALFSHSAGATVVLLILFILGHQAAKTSGISLAEALRDEPQPLVRVYLKPSAPEKQSADVVASNSPSSPMPDPFKDEVQFDDTQRVTVLFATKNKYFLLVQGLPTKEQITNSGNSNPKYRPEARVVEIRADEIAYLTTKLGEMVP